MPTAQYTALANITLASTATSVTFSSISQAYRDLRLVIDAKYTATAYTSMNLRFNGDSGSNYNYVQMSGDGSGYSSSYSANNAQTYIGGYSLIQNDSNVFTADLMDYSATNKHKNLLGRDGHPTTGLGASIARWANTAAITTILIYPDGGNPFAVGTTFALYGVK